MIEIIKCDIFKSNADVICHQVNTFGIMGAGIAAQIMGHKERLHFHFLFINFFFFFTISPF